MNVSQGAQLAEGEEVFVAHSGWLRFPDNDHVCALVREGSFDVGEEFCGLGYSCSYQPALKANRMPAA